MVAVVIPKLDETTEAVTVERWLVREGERVEQGQAVCEVETDKALVPVEAPAAGTLRRQLVAAGTEAPPLTVVALVGDPGEPAPEAGSFARAGGGAESAMPASGAPAAVGPPSGGPPSGARSAATPAGSSPAPPDSSPTSSAPPGASVTPASAPLASEPLASGPPPSAASPAPASPRARRLAEELGVDLRTVAGTGPGGKITDRDVQRVAGV